jgi:transposase-like protein
MHWKPGVRGAEGGLADWSSSHPRRRGKLEKMTQEAVRVRRHIPAEKKYAILEELRQSTGNKSEILRREGLYTADVQRYEAIAREGAIRALGLSRPGRRSPLEVTAKEYELLKNELARKDKALSEMAVEFTILKKKVNGE